MWFIDSSLTDWKTFTHIIHVRACVPIQGKEVISFLGLSCFCSSVYDHKEAQQEGKKTRNRKGKGTERLDQNCVQILKADRHKEKYRKREKGQPEKRDRQKRQADKWTHRQPTRQRVTNRLTDMSASVHLYLHSISSSNI